MPKIKRYIDCAIPIDACNLRCHYCYITQKRKFKSSIQPFTHSIEEYKRAFSIERLGGICLINMCAGGETLLSNEILPIIKELAQMGHYISIVTNGTLTKRFLEISKWDDCIKSHIFVKFSLQYLEMIRYGWLERFANNVNMIKNANVSFTVEITPSDELIPYIDEVKKYCIDSFGALCHVSIARDERTTDWQVLSNLDFESFKNTWKVFDSCLFDFKSQLFYVKRKEFCYAGDWSIVVDFESGEIKHCNYSSAIGNLFDFSKAIDFRAIGKNCPSPHCYNGHSFLSLGAIPEINSVSYDMVRNRKAIDGTEWLQPEMKKIMQCRLEESNRQYGSFKKWKVSSNHRVYRSIRRKISKVKNKIVQ